MANEMAGRLYAEGQTVELLVFTRFEGVFASMPEQGTSDQSEIEEMRKIIKGFYVCFTSLFV